MHRERAQCELSAMVTNGVTDPIRWSCGLVKGVSEGNFDLNPI